MRITSASCKAKASDGASGAGCGMALAADGGAPAWVQLLPKGPAICGRDGRGWTMSSAEAVVTASLNGQALHIDYEHASEHRARKGQAAPAAGWINALEARENGIWAQVEWTPRAAQMIADREYRFISPVFTYRRDSGEIAQLISAGLTNQPNLDMTALNQRGEPGTGASMTLKALCQALSLNEEASPEAMLAAVNALIKRADHPPLEKFVPRADYDAAVKKAADAETALSQIKASARETEITELVEGAIKAGKITPATKDFYLTTCRADGGNEAFKSFLNAAPVLSVKTDSGLDRRQDPSAAHGALNDQEKTVCRNLGVTEDDYLKARATAH